MDNVIAVSLTGGRFIKTIERGKRIIFWYNNPNGRGQAGWRQGVVRESQNEYILTYDDHRQGETRRFKRRCMTQLSFIN
jgi:hypothetical protein